MKRFVPLMVSIGVLACASAAAPAFALNEQTKSPKTTVAPASSLVGAYVDQTNSANLSNTKQQSKVYQWSLKGRWGLKLDVTEDQSRPSGWNDVDAGAFYKISPSVRVGGTVGFGEKKKSLQPTGPVEDKEQPRVRLETTFKF